LIDLVELLFSIVVEGTVELEDVGLNNITVIVYVNET